MPGFVVRCSLRVRCSYPISNVEQLRRQWRPVRFLDRNEFCIATDERFEFKNDEIFKMIFGTNDDII